MKKLHIFISFILLFLFSVTAVQASVIVSTLPQTSSNDVGIGGTNDYAAGFVWGTTETFASADLYLGVEGEPTASLFVSLFDDAGGSPGSSVLALSGPTGITTAGLYAYTGLAALTSGSTYWLVASTGTYGDSDNEYIWYDGTLGDSGYVDTQWRRLPTFVSWSSSSLVVPAAFRVNSVSVPEPATLALFGIGLAGLGFSRRNKSNSA